MGKIKLTQPITIDGKQHDHIILRRPKVKDRLIVERMGSNDAEKEVALIANLAGLPQRNYRRDRSQRLHPDSKGVTGFFTTTRCEDLMTAVLSMAHFAKGGISEWLEMPIDEFMQWLTTAQKMMKE